MNIIARKRVHSAVVGSADTEYVVVDRGEGVEKMRFVSATVNALSLRHNEWFWGHYFATEEEAMRHFNDRPMPLGAITDPVWK